jgi:hypothetical protein
MVSIDAVSTIADNPNVTTIVDICVMSMMVDMWGM